MASLLSAPQVGITTQKSADDKTNNQIATIAAIVRDSPRFSSLKRWG